MGGGGCPGCSRHLALQSSQALHFTVTITINIAITIAITITIISNGNGNSVVVLVVPAIWLYSLCRLHTVWERTLNYTQVHSREETVRVTKQNVAKLLQY